MSRFSQDPRDPRFVQDPYPAYARMRALGPAVWWEEYGFWCLHRFADVNAALRDRRLGREILHVATREELGWAPVPERLAPFYAFEANSLLEREPPVHTRLRRLVNRAFVSRAIEARREGVARLAHRLIDAIEGESGGEGEGGGEGGGEGARAADLLAAFCTPIPLVVIAELLGAPVEAADRMLAWSHDMVAMYQFGRDRAAEDRAVAATEAFSAFMRAHVEARRAAPGDDLISALIAAEEAGDRLSTDELITTCILLMNAGHEATVHALGNGVAAALSQGAGRPGAADAAAWAEEILRWDPPLHLFTRYALEDLEVAGVRLRKGEQVGLLLAAAGRDPERHADPDRFDPGRPAQGHVAFGAGIHFCVGAPLARLEMEVALPILFQRLPRLRLAATPRYADRFHFHGLERLDATF